MHLQQHAKNDRPSKREGANLQGAGSKSETNIAKTNVNPDGTEGKNKFVQWNYFPDWNRTSPGKNALYEKCLFQKACFGLHKTTFDVMIWRQK